MRKDDCGPEGERERDGAGASSWVGHTVSHSRVLLVEGDQVGAQSPAFSLLRRPGLLSVREKKSS